VAGVRVSPLTEHLPIALACRYFTARSLIGLNGLGEYSVAVLEPTSLYDATFHDSVREHTVQHERALRDKMEGGNELSGSAVA
jgi:hypothetical protein